MDAGLISLIGILVAMAFLIIASIKGLPILVVGPVSAVIVFAFAGMGPAEILENMSGPYAEDFAGFAQSNFLLFLPACVLGAMLGDCGAAQKIAIKIGDLAQKMGGGKGDFMSKYLVIIGLSVITAILSFGGVSGFVVIFTIAPICREIFKKMDIPWHFVIAVAVYGGSMWTAILPGSPSVQNLMPMSYLDTEATAAPMLAIIGSLTCIVFGAWYIWFVLRRNLNRGEGYLPTGALMEANSSELDTSILGDTCTNWEFIKALLPSVVLLVCMNVILVDYDPWLSLVIGCVVCYALYFNKFQNIGKTMGAGCTSTMKSIMNVSAVVGFGAAVELAPGFQFVVDNLNAIPGTPLIQLCLATNLVAGITGSASGGEAIALNLFADRFLQMGIQPDVIHRVVAVSCYGLDSMPYNGSAINRLNYTNLDYKRGYIHEFILGAIFPFLNSFFVVFLASLGIV